MPKIIPMVGWLATFIKYVCDNIYTDYASFSISRKEPLQDYNNYWILDASVDFSKGSPENPDELRARERDQKSEAVRILYKHSSHRLLPITNSQ